MKLVNIFNNLYVNMNKAKTAKELKVEKVMKEFAEGKLKSSDGKIVTDRDQAIAIAMSESGQSMQKAIRAIYAESKRTNDIDNKEQKMIKSKILKINNKYYRLNKAKKVPIGTVSKGQKKVAEGKWVPVKSDMPKPTTSGEEKKPKKDDKKKKEPTPEENTIREKMKVALKKIATILADALSGKDVVQPTGQGVEEVGERLKQNKKQPKIEKNKPSEKPKGKK